MKADNNLQIAYDEWHRREHGEDHVDEIHLDPWHRNILNYLKDLRLFNGKKILEVGCGPGDFSILISKNGANVSAIDFSGAAIEISKRKAKFHNLDVDFQEADAQNLPYNESSFDYLFSFECLEHIPDPKKMIAECYRVLKPGGTLFLTTENYSNGLILLWVKTWLTKSNFNSGTDQPLENFFLYWQLIKKFKRVGFKVIHFFGTHHVFFLFPGFHPHKFVKNKFKNRILKYLFRPFARHMAYVLVK